MSFAGTPLGQGRRLDHNAFLGKPPSTGNRPPSPHRIIPTSYAYGAPTLGSRSPPKPTSPTRERNKLPNDQDDNDSDSALTRYARIKQREQASFAGRPGGPKVITSPPHPEKWSVKGTSVNIAQAFQQAASDMNPQNSAWASGSTKTNHYPRSTSVEYEQETQQSLARRLAPPPNRLSAPRSTVSSNPPISRSKPLSKQASLRHVVPDSEEEASQSQSQSQPRNGRGTSPFEQVLNAGGRALSMATYYVRQRSQEPGEQSMTNGKPDSSYSYSAEERDYQDQQNAPKRGGAMHKRGRMSTDNKAYKPSHSDDEESEEEESENEGKPRRRKKKKDLGIGGPLSTLPVISQDKRKKRKGKSKSKGNATAADEEDSESSDHGTDRQSAQRASRGGSAPIRVSASRAGSVQPEPQDTSEFVDQTLNTIPEFPEEEMDIDQGPANDSNDASYEQSLEAPHPSATSAALGSIIYNTYRIFSGLATVLYNLLSSALFVTGRVCGTLVEITFLRPIRWLSRADTGPVVSLIKYIILGTVILGAWYTLSDPLKAFVPKFSSGTTYHPPDVPAANIAELNSRLQHIETILAGLTSENAQTRARADTEERAKAELAGRLGALESRVQKDSARSVEAETQFRDTAKRGLQAVTKEVEVLHAQIQAVQQQAPRSETDEEARAKLKALEERVGSVEGGVREALEMGKNAVKTDAGGSAAWWTKLATGKKGLTIKSSDGQDVMGLIGQLVESSVSMYGKDTLARPDFALHSGGARIIPSLTSPTFEMRPQNMRGQLVGMLTGNGYAIGRPPITALHPELHVGNCWSLEGSQGQLGVALAAPTYITDISIDHVAKEVAFDMRTAPRQMEVWAMVEGKDNVAKVRAWREETDARRAEALERGEEVEEDEPYPRTLPKSPLYIRIAAFNYDIHAPHNVQTFPVSQDVRDLGVDFGIVVLRVLNNWGRDEYTCLYRLRVHGQRMGETPLPYPEEIL